MSKGLPEAKYTRFGEKIRHVIPGPVQCSVACGGRNCKWENPSRWPEHDQVIKGVFSSWVIEDVVAMSRPSTEVIVKYNLIKQFKDNNIRSIINLQRPGEHASCGPPLNKESLFTYDPKVFMDSDVFFYNFGWKDYGVTSLETILDMVKVMTFALSEGKVAVHCHAGLGRTGVLIACYLVYARRLDASEAINTVRNGRPNSIQTRGQIACIQEFAQFLRPLRIVFPQVAPNAERLTLERFLHHQRHLLHGFESRELRYLPKLVSVICRRLIEIGTTSQDSMWYESPLSSSSKPKSARKKKESLRRSNTVETLMETIPGAFVNEKHESDEFVDSVDSQKMNAILSPRLTRRHDSARSRSSSEAKSQSRPESPTMSLDISTEVEIPFNQPRESSSPPRKTPTSPILVSCAPAQIIPVENDDEELNKLSGNPNVLLVKRGSRPVLSSLSQSYSSMDANSNNNNQTALVTEINQDLNNELLNSPVPSGNIDLARNIDQPDRQTEFGASNEASTFLHVENANKNDAYDTAISNLPLPTLSPHEPQVSPAVTKDYGLEIAAGDKSVIDGSQKVGDLVEQKDFDIPQQHPLRSLTLSLLAGDSIISENDDCQIEFDQSYSIDYDEHDTTKDEEKPRCSSDGDEVKEMELVEEVVDDVLNLEVEQVSGTKRDGELTTLQQAEFVMQETTVTCKISWSEANDDAEETPELTIPSRSESDGRQTPLMYRAGKVLDLLDSTLTDNEYDLEASMIDIDGREAAKLDDDLAKLSLDKPLARQGKRPKSAGFLKRLAEKNRNDDNETESPTLVTTARSLCDLSGITALSHDDIELMRCELNQDPFASVSPNSEDSEEVFTPCGSATKRKIKDPITVAMALGYKLTNDEWMWEKVYSKQRELNTREEAWSSLDIEDDPYVLSCLMWSWIEHLSKPILTSGQVAILVRQSKPDYDAGNHTADPALFEKALSAMDKPVSSSLRCILHCLSSLPPLPLEPELSAVRRCISAFTQSKVENGDVAIKDSENLDDNEQLVCLMQNHIVKTRVKNAKTKAILESSDPDDSSKRRTSVPEAKSSELPTSAQLKAEYPRGDGDTVTGASKVPELPPRIAVS